jgi:serine/threonine protein kinase
MLPAAGVRVGSYELLAQIGSGGMGVVFKARDTRLERFVAIKFLLQEKDGPSDRGRRFMLEARAASALNHPHIITVHDIASESGQTFIVMEYIDGHTLSDLTGQRPMKLADLLGVAIQVADALSTAHEAGIVHRDLKPGNIMVNSHGQVKVLDFGLAKLMSPKDPFAGEAQTTETTRTIADQSKTAEGTILGSFHYMSPEQAQGLPIDARSDIFSFGSVLYEMVTGQRAFAGEGPISTLALIIGKDPPPVTTISSNTPPELERIISRCLRKDVTRRSQHISDVKLQLQEVKTDLESRRFASATRVPSRRSLWLALGLALALLAVCTVAWELSHRNSREASRMELERLSPDDDFTYTDPVISPDGKFVAYVSDRSGSAQLWLQQIGDNEPLQLTHEREGVNQPMFSPDGTHLVYVLGQYGSSHGLCIISTLGGASRELVGDNASRPRFSPNGQLILYLRLHSYSDDKSPDTKYMVVPTQGGFSRPVKTGPLDISFRSAAVWMDDKRIILTAQDSLDLLLDWFLVPVDGGKSIAMRTATYLEKAGVKVGEAKALYHDRVIFSSSNHIWEVPISRSSWKISGAPRQLTFGTEPESTSFIASSGSAAVGLSRTKSDVWFLPMDVAAGRITGAPRRITQDGRKKVSLRFPGPSNVFLLTLGRHESTGSTMSFMISRRARKHCYPVSLAG